MKKWLVPIILIALAVIFGVRVYNSTIGLEENV